MGHPKNGEKLQDPAPRLDPAPDPPPNEAPVDIFRGGNESQSGSKTSDKKTGKKGSK
jgi:hypothetical protein